jgi:hypothetical protein
MKKSETTMDMARKSIAEAKDGAEVRKIMLARATVVWRYMGEQGLADTIADIDGSVFSLAIAAGFLGYSQGLERERLVDAIDAGIEEVNREVELTEKQKGSTN